MEKALISLPGVDKAVVNLGAKNVSVIYDPTRISADGMKKAIIDAGYSIP